ncbi:hypothetical protein H4V98_002496 [Polaromonas sp. CG_23.6]|nr:hypothetical protein [Polaromonas sp. CG_23.6]
MSSVMGYGIQGQGQFAYIFCDDPSLVHVRNRWMKTWVPFYVIPE